MGANIASRSSASQGRRRAPEPETDPDRFDKGFGADLQ